MNRMQKHNLYNIKRNFEKKTGTRLIFRISPQDQEPEDSIRKVCTPRKRISRIAVIAAIVTIFLTLTAFAVTIFSVWGGDRLTMTASYHGGGIVWVEITNQSDKDMKLEPTMKLYYYSTQESVESTGEEPYISNLTIPANSTQKVRLDLRRTYDIEALENNKNDFYCLQLTNDGFLPGQKWTCMVYFVVSDYVPPYYECADDRNLNDVLLSLKSYYYNFTPDIFARWPDAFDYMELVEAELGKLDGNIVRPSNPDIYLDTYDWLGANNYSAFDGYNKLMGRDDTEYYTQPGVQLPTILDDGRPSGGGWTLPLFYLYKYALADIRSPQDYAFIRGNLLTFEEMEPYKVYDDGEYVIYEMHHLFYTDLKTYVEDMLLQRDDVYLNEQLWERIENFYNHWRDQEVMGSSFYRSGESRATALLTIPDVLRISQKGEDICFQDFLSYWGGANGLTIDESETGYTYTIDGNYTLFYAMYLDGTPKGWYLIHNPSGDVIDIRNEDVEAFVESHGDPLPRCSCENSENTADESHGWYITMEWLLEQGNDIETADLGYACSYHKVIDDPDLPAHIFLIHKNDEFYIEDRWNEAANKWTLWLVHIESGDRCDLETEDAKAFVLTHGGEA